jgi:hypothetical protein
MDIETTKYIILNAPNQSIMLHAKHGVGKSSVVKQCAEEMNGQFYDVRLSQCEVGDIKGLPYRDGNKVLFAKPEWFPTDPNSKGILFFDELNRASKDVLQAVFEICLDRRLDGVKIPDGWKIVSAVNSDDDYDVIELDPALADRWFHIEFDPTVKDWLNWAGKSGIHASISQFISRNHVFLDPPVGNLEAGKVYPSRRSWVAFNGWLKQLNLVNNPSLMVQTAKGWLGQEIAITFQKFVENEFSLLTAADVLDRFSENEDKIEQSCSDIEVIAVLSNNVIKDANKRMAKEFGDLQQDNLYKFFMLLPNDVASNMWSEIVSGKKTKKLLPIWQAKAEFKDRLKEIYLS